MPGNVTAYFGRNPDHLLCLCRSDDAANLRAFCDFNRNRNTREKLLRFRTARCGTLRSIHLDGVRLRDRYSSRALRLNLLRLLRLEEQRVTAGRESLQDEITARVSYPALPRTFLYPNLDTSDAVQRLICGLCAEAGQAQ